MHLFRDHKFLIVVLVLALLMRVPVLFFGIPQAIHPDDAYVLGPAILIAEHPTANPYKFGLPDSTLFYSEAAALRVGFSIARLTHITHAPTIAHAYAAQERWVFVTARALNLAYILGVLVLVYALTRRLFQASSAIGASAALLVAASSMLIEHVAYIRPDIPLAWWSLLVVWCATEIHRTHGSRRSYIAAGITIGIALATKYPGILGAVSLVIAHLSIARPKRQTRNLWGAAGIALMVWLVLVPHALDSPTHLIKDVLYEGRAHHPGADGLSWLGNMKFYATTTLTWGMGTFAILAAVSTALYVLIIKRQRDALIVAAFPLTFFYTLSAHALHWDRWMIPLLPFCAIFAAGGVALLAKKSPRLAATLAVLIILPACVRGIRTTESFLQPETREIAAQWIANNLPAHAHVVRDRYAPILNGAIFRVTNYDTVAEKTITQYKKAHVDYLIESSDQRNKITDGATSQFLEIHQRDVDAHTHVVTCIPSQRNERAQAAIEAPDWQLLAQPRTSTTIGPRGPQICIRMIY